MAFSNKRTLEDICLLCKTKPATKKNSHVFPKFWLKNMFITKDNQREGWQISTTPRNLDKVGQKVQDSPKQDYLFCPECEERFGVVERYTANHFYNRYRDPSTSEDFPVTRKPRPELDYVTALQVNPVMFKLFIYSLVWRASVSTHPVFNNFKLPAKVEEGLRELLDIYIRNTEADTIAFSQQHASEFPHLPLNIVTTAVASDATANFVQPFLAPDGKVLIFANEFIIIFYPDWDAPRNGPITNNFAESPLAFVVMTLNEWHDYHQRMVRFFVNTTLHNAGMVPAPKKTFSQIVRKKLGW